jgi:hypothetical protein
MEEHEELKVLNDSLNIAKEYGLQAEVMWSAFKVCRTKPDIPMAFVMEAALCEWDLLE